MNSTETTNLVIFLSAKYLNEDFIKGDTNEVNKQVKDVSLCSSSGKCK